MTGRTDAGQWWSMVWGSAIAGAFDEATELEAGARLAARSSFERPEVSPGSMTLRDADWVAHLGVRQLDDSRWETILRTIAADPQLTAAVVTGELPVELHGRAVALGCSLAPERRDLGADCSCPDWHEPCRHVGALASLVADLITGDPWLVTMLRGRTRDEVIETVRRLRADQRGIDPSGDTPRGVDPGVSATAAFKTETVSLPSPLAPLRRAGHPVEHAPPPIDSGIVGADLERLVADAAQRAFRLLSDDGDPTDAAALLISPEEDRARIEGHSSSSESLNSTGLPPL